jgi:hypothetical protein
LTSFVDVVSKAGTTKLTAVRKLIRRPDEYDPRRDFYRPLREAIIAAHRDGKGKEHLEGLAERQSDQKKRTNYPPAVKAYRKWWGRKSWDWFEPARGIWQYNSMSVRVNPELGLERNGKKRLIKLYFKSEKLSKLRVDVILHLMEETLREDHPNAIMCVHDIRHERLFEPTVEKDGLGALLEGEAAFVETTWKRLTGGMSGDEPGAA